MSIRKVKTYRVRCEGWVVDPYQFGGEAACETRIDVQGTSRLDAMNSLPEGWEWTNDNGTDVLCPREDHA